MYTVIIKGNPVYINNNPMAIKFYAKIKSFLIKYGCTVTFDAGLDKTLPDTSADLWVAHSRGISRFNFAPKGIKLIGFGGLSDKGVIVNHPLDNTIHNGGLFPNKYHYVFMNEMKRQLRQLLGE